MKKGTSSTAKKSTKTKSKTQKLDLNVPNIKAAAKTAKKNQNKTSSKKVGEKQTKSTAKKVPKKIEFDLVTPKRLKDPKYSERELKEQKELQKDQLDLVGSGRKKANKWISKNIVLSTITTSIVAVPVSVGIVQLDNSIKRYEFKGMKFNSLNSVEKYVKKNSKVETERVQVAENKWSIELEGIKYTFDSPEELRDYLFNSFIKKEQYTTTLNLNERVDLGTGKLMLTDEELATLHKGGTESAKLIDVFLGKSDAAYKNADDAQKSLFMVQDAYYFNGMYFNSKEELRKYLISDYLQNKDNVNLSFNTIVLVGPNGSKSNPIKVDKDNPEETVGYIDGFIRSNYVTTLEYTNSVSQNTIQIDNKNKHEKLDEINMKDLSYQHVYSNQGESRYVLDVTTGDEHNLMGPYFYQGNLDAGAFANKSMWKKANNIKKQVYEESKIDQAIGDFFSIVSNDNVQLGQEENNDDNAPALFRTFITNESGQRIDPAFIEDLHKFDPKLAQEVLDMNENLTKTKRFNTFYKVPILYSFILERLLTYSNSQKMIDITVKYFTDVANFLQDAIEIAVVDESLLYREIDNKRFSVVDLFNIGNPEFDLNTSMESFMGEIKTFKKMIAAIVTYTGALNNINMLGGLMQFKGYDLSPLITNRVIDQVTLEKITPSLENIFNIYSSLDYQTMHKNFVKATSLHTVIDIKNKPESEWEKELETAVTKNTKSPFGLFLRGVGIKNTMLFSLSREVLKEEINQYNKTQKINPKGLLFKLENKVKPFIQLIDANPGINEYQAYMAILIDIRSNSGIFNTTSSIANYQAFVQNVGRLTFITLAAPVVVANVIDKIYFWYGGVINNPGASSAAANKMVNLFESILNGVSDFKNNLSDRITRSGTYFLDGLPTPEIRGKARWWSSLDFFSKLDNALDAINKNVLPIFATAFAAFELGMLIFDLLKVEKITDYYVFTTRDGTEFIWNGGETVKKFFGFDVTVTSNISNMILADPIQITLPQLEDFYFFNGIKYYDEREIKLANVNYYLDSTSNLNNPHFKLKFSFDKKDNDGNLFSTYDSVDLLVDGVLAALRITKKSDGTWDVSNIDENSKYIDSTNYAFDSGITTDASNTVDVVASNIVDNIRPTLVSKLPKIDNGIFDGEASNEFVFPGLVWYPDRIVDNTSKMSEYVVDNSANELKPKVSRKDLPPSGTITENDFLIKDPKEARKKSHDALYKKFTSKFVPQQKSVLVSEYFLNGNKYSDFDNILTSKYLYKIVAPGISNSLFVDEFSAQNYLLKYTKFEQFKKTVTHKTYYYDDFVFRDESSLRMWIENNVLVV